MTVTKEEQQAGNLTELRKILDGGGVEIYPACLDGAAYAPTKKRPVMRFGLAITKDAFDGNISELGERGMVVVFVRRKAK